MSNEDPLPPHDPPLALGDKVVKKEEPCASPSPYDDRPALAEDGKTMLPQRWSTPVRDHRAMGAYRLASRGEARYAPSSGEYAYLEVEVREVTTEIVPNNRGRP